ncbi:MAG TPA: hypothetical protein EYG95_06040 [Campylobacterales bacterium]|nr:hypothetical protein [Campylobacterales bacterium]
MIKKILLTAILLIIIAGGAFFFMNSSDNYDASKYSATATTMVEGESIDFTLPDQFDKAHTLSADTKTLVLTFAKETSHIVRDFLQTQPDDYLSSRNAYYIADISPMPTVIRNAFAMPDLKKSAYPVILIYDGTIAAKFKDEAQKNSIMIVSLENKKITSVKFAEDVDTLKALLK